MNKRLMQFLSDLTLEDAQAQIEDLRDQRNKLIATIGHMRRIARPYPQWERWWHALGGEYIGWLNKLEETDDQI